MTRPNLTLLAMLLSAAPMGDAPPVEALRADPPRPPADPDEVRRLATEGTAREIVAYRRAHRLSDAERAAERAAWAKAMRANAPKEEATPSVAPERRAMSPLSVRCPKCSAKPGKRCHGPNAFMDVPHPARVRAARRRTT